MAFERKMRWGWPTSVDGASTGGSSLFTERIELARVARRDVGADLVSFAGWVFEPRPLREEVRGVGAVKLSALAR